MKEEKSKRKSLEQSQEPTKNLQYQYIAGPFIGKASGLTTTSIMEKQSAIYYRIQEVAKLRP